MHSYIFHSFPAAPSRLNAFIPAPHTNEPTPNPSKTPLALQNEGFPHRTQWAVFPNEPNPASPGPLLAADSPSC